MIVGIDLGTTNSLIAVWKDNQPHLVPNRFGKTLTPSAVGVDEQGTILIGESAQSSFRSVAHFKRYMGTNKTFTLGNHIFRSEELSALLLKSLINDAEAYLGEKIEEAVISVPAYFNDMQRKATRLTGKLAGLNVERLINEPTAAALAYGLHQRDAETKFLVFDLGGGTFDVSIVEIFSGIIEVRSSAGDNHLGGKDFSDALEEAIKAHLWKEHAIDHTQFDQEAAFKVRQGIESLKLQLSKTSEGRFCQQFETGAIEILFSRQLFKTLSEPLLERLRRPVEQALRDARIRPQELDAVILVGGATRMPMIQEEVAKMLGVFPQFTVHPDEAVALGAAIQAALKARHHDLMDVVLTDVCPFSLGTSVCQHSQSGELRFFPIIERNTTIPTSKSKTVYSVCPNQKEMRIDVYQGESYRVEDNIKIGEFLISIPPGPPGTEVDIRYSYDVNGLLEVEATVLSTHKQKKILIKNQDFQLSEAEIEASLDKLKKIKIHPRDLQEHRLLVAKLEHLFEFCKGEERDGIASVLSAFIHALETQVDSKILETKQAVEDFLAEFEIDA